MAKGKAANMDPIQEHEDSGSDYDETTTRSKSKRNATKPKALQQGRQGAPAPKTSSNSNTEEPQAGSDMKKAEIQARRRARVIQQDTSTVFVKWQANMGHGDPYTWDQDRILYDPLVFQYCKTDEEFFKIAPKYAYYSDRGVQAAIACRVTNDNRGRFIGADLDANGDILTGRTPRGLPALDVQGNIVMYCTSVLHGELELDISKYSYKNPGITRGNGRAAIKGPEPVWHPASKQAYIQLYEKSTTARTLKGVPSTPSDSNAATEATALLGHDAEHCNASLPLRGPSPFVESSKRSARVAGLAESDLTLRSKRSQISSLTSLTGSRLPPAANNSSVAMPIRGGSEIASSNKDSQYNSNGSIADANKQASQENLQEMNISLKERLQFMEEAMREHVTKTCYNQVVTELQACITSLKEQQQISQQQNSEALADILQQQEILQSKHAKELADLKEEY
ncbi:hypothetical protein ONS96_005356 [Cadophora gregata f. sp. sojae]|nr:hypothetical protein ONS96_005356 [Cadophora gregata f. sp. sojae]